MIFYGSAIDAKTHNHHAIQVVWETQNAHCVWPEGELSGSFIIGPGVKHQVKLNEGWILLIEPSSILGLSLKRLLGSSGVISINNMVKRYSVAATPILQPIAEISQLFEQLNIDVNFAVNDQQITDNRIQKLMDKLNLCLLDECQKPANWRAANVAAELYLSESRFLHLFKQQLGVAWRPYLRWRRLSCACNAIAKGASVTEAAYIAGFSDGPHLSKTFNSMFGLTITDAKAIFFKD